MKTSVNLAGVELKNPVMTASGTFGSGAEYSEFVDLKELGAVVTKGVANVPWPGNPTPRIAEVYGGMLNAIGLQNPGIDVFCERDIPFLKQFDTKIVVNVCGRTTEDYCEVVERLTSEPVDLLEINISCPNVKEGGIAFGQDPKAVEAITREVKKYAKQPIIMKLSPNVTDITEMARAAEAGGADVLSLINTLTGMKIDIERQKFAIANKTGGMSGPAVKPIAVRMVYQVAQAVKVPIIGMGGIAFGQDPKAVEAITREVKKYAKQPIIMKLSPNVTDITEMARAAEAGGADVLSLINTLTGMKIDIERQKFAIANKTGGMSGPAVKPIAVRMVYQVAQAVKVPIIGMGGIASAEDALEFILAGATAVSIGTANFFNPYATVETVRGIEEYMRRHKVDDINSLIGAVR